MNIGAKIKNDIIEQIIKEKNSSEGLRERAPFPTRQATMYKLDSILTAEREITKLESKVNFGIAKLAMLAGMIEEEKEKIYYEKNKDVKDELEQKLKLLITENNNTSIEVDDWIFEMRCRVQSFEKYAKEQKVELDKSLELHHLIMNRAIATIHATFPEGDNKYRMYLMNGETELCHKEQHEANLASTAELMAKNNNKP